MSNTQKRTPLKFTDVFSRNQGSLTKKQQDMLRQKKVAVVGCGGLGGYVIEQLVRLGLGTVHCFDPDSFSASNCNRQLGALITTLGQNKAQVLAERAATVHPFSTVIPFLSDFREAQDPQAFVVDVVVDCLDDIGARHDLAALCARRRLTLVHGAVNGWSGQVGVVPPGGTLFQKLYPDSVKEGCEVKSSPSVLSCTVACIAGMQVAEVIKLLLGLPSELLDAALYLDLKEFECVKLS